jgi:hypothetical protein
MIFIRSALFPVMLVAIAVFVFSALFSSCGDEESAPCVGTITKAYTTISVSGGYNNVPATSSTKYQIAVKRDDGTACERKLKKRAWLGVEPGQHIDAEGNIT